MSGHVWEVDGFGVDELCASNEITELLAPHAADLAERINATTPAQHSNTPFKELKGSWTSSGRHVTTTSRYWHLAEYGTRTSPPYAPVRNAMQALGFTNIDVSIGVEITP